jgi:SWIM zinc finger
MSYTEMMQMKPKNIKHLQAQSRDMELRRINRLTYGVKSLSDPKTEYRVRVQFRSDRDVVVNCNCPWAQHHGVACSHVMATLEYLASLKGRTLSFWLTNEEAERQKHRVFYLQSEDNRHEGVWITSRAG